jgi:protease II
MATPTKATIYADDTIAPPVADIVPHTSVHHGRTLVDDYAWLQKKDAQIYAFLIDTLHGI